LKNGCVDVIFLRESFFNSFFCRLQIAIDIQLSSFYFLRVVPLLRPSVFILTQPGRGVFNTEACLLQAGTEEEGFHFKSKRMNAVHITFYNLQTFFHE